MVAVCTCSFLQDVQGQRWSLRAEIIMARSLFPYATALRICICVYSALLASWKTLTFFHAMKRHVTIYCLLTCRVIGMSATQTSAAMRRKRFHTTGVASLLLTLGHGLAHVFEQSSVQFSGVLSTSMLVLLGILFGVCSFVGCSPCETAARRRRIETWVQIF